MIIKKKIKKPTLIFYPDGASEIVDDRTEKNKGLAENIHWYSPGKALGESLITILALIIFTAFIYVLINRIL